MTETVWPDWAIYWTLGKFLKPLATINLPKSPTFFSNFHKVVKIFHFSCDIIFGQLLWTFGDLFLVTLDRASKMGLYTESGISKSICKQRKISLNLFWRMRCKKAIEIAPPRRPRRSVSMRKGRSKLKFIFTFGCNERHSHTWTNMPFKVHSNTLFTF